MFFPNTDDKTTRRSWGTYPPPPIPFEKTLFSDFGATIQISGTKNQIYSAKNKIYAPKLKYVAPKIKYLTPNSEK